MMKSILKHYSLKRLLTYSLGPVSIMLVVLAFCSPFKTNFEIYDDLGGNIFPSLILPFATTDTLIVVPPDSTYLGNPKSCFAIRLNTRMRTGKLRISISGTSFFEESVSEFDLEKAWKDYLVYPDVVWKYDALRANIQPIPVSISIKVEFSGADLGQRVRTFSMRSINECMLGYRDIYRKFHDTGICFAAYVNEDHPMIDKLLREALDTRLVDRFTGYQSPNKTETVDKQVYALWYALQMRNFKYSSVSNSSLSSNVVFSQRVRTLDNSLEYSQINCVDGSVLFASLLRAINIDPILVKTPTHMFVGYYTDRLHTKMDFLETGMIGDVNLADYFPDEHIDSTMAGKTRRQISKFTFEKSKEYARLQYDKSAESIKEHQPFYMFIEISDKMRRLVQSIGK